MASASTLPAPPMPPDPTFTVPPPFGGLLRAAAPLTGKDAQLALLESRLQAQADELLRLAAELRDRDDVIAALREQLGAARQQLEADRKRQVEEAVVRELSTIHCEIEGKRRAIESLELATDASRRIADLSTGTARANGELERLRSAVADADLRAARADEDCRRAQAMAARSEEDLKREVHAQRELSQLEVSEALRRAADQSRAVEERTSTELQQLRHAVADREQQLSASAAVQEGLRTEVRELTDYVAAMQKQLRDTSAEADQWRSKVNSVQSGLEHAHSTLQARAADFEVARTELSERMRRDLDTVTAAAREEHSTLRRRMKKQARALDEVRARLEIAEDEAAAQRGAAAAAEIAKLETRRALEVAMRKSADLEQDMRSARAAAAEARTEALLEYVSERGEMERGRSTPLHDVEVRQLCRITRKILSKFTKYPEPATAANDCKLQTLKLLLLSLQSYVGRPALHAPPPPRRR